MSQYQVRTGPIINDAAAFTSSMVDGVHPDKPRLFVGPRVGWQIAQTSHVVAAFGPEMIAGWHSDTPAKIFLGPKQGWSISQSTHTAAAFSVEMSAGSAPDRPRRFDLKAGWSWSELTFAPAMTPEQFAGWHPDSGRVFLGPQLPQPLHQAAQHVPAPFSHEMASGWHPDVARCFVPPRLGLQIAQSTPTSAAFGHEMAAGSHPDSGRCFVGPRVGWRWSETTFLAQMTAEMFAGSHPDTPRAWIAPRIPLPESQTSHVPTPFGQEMAIGSRPDQSRAFQMPRAGWATSQTTFPVTMTPEMWSGWRPDTSRAWLAPKIPLPIAQPTHVQAAFGHEMVQGSQPAQARLPVQGRFGWLTSQTTFLVQMTAEMFAGWMPDRSRAWLAPKIPLPVSQTTHTAAPFSQEMVQGSQPPTKRQSFAKQVIGWIQGLIDGTFRPVGPAIIHLASIAWRVPVLLLVSAVARLASVLLATTGTADAIAFQTPTLDAVTFSAPTMSDVTQEDAT